MCDSSELDVLLRRAAAGDAGSERALVEHFAPRVRAMALARTRDADLSRDLTQETLVALLQAFRKGQVRDHGKVAGFVAGVARNPFGVVFRALVRPRLAPPSELEDPRPPTFAQLVGFLVTGTGVVLGLVGLSTAVPIAASLAFVAAFLNAAFGYCLGCRIHLLLVRARVIRAA